MALEHHEIRPGRQFNTTRWSLIAAAGDRASPDQKRALTVLCETYWYPVYAFIRRQGRNEAEAEDLTQSFFAALLDKEYVRDADRARGRFRTFLLTAARHYLANEYERAVAQKRGGGRTILSLDFGHAEDRYRLEPVGGLTPEQIYERRWAMTVLDAALTKLREYYTVRERGEAFEHLKPHLAGGSSTTYQQTAEQLGITVAAVKQQVRRIRQRYGDLARAEVADTVADVEEIEEEVDRLFRAVSG